MDQNPLHLVQLAQDPTARGRRTLAFSVSDLFSEPEASLSDQERAIAAEILDRLIRAFETEIRRELAERLAPKPGIPRSLILMLANDEIEVARPILLQSEVLCARDLIDIIREHGFEHQVTIAKRKSLPEAVCDALVETDNVAVIETLLKNPGARLAEVTLSYLVEEAHWVEGYREPLAQRRELQPPLAKRLYRLVSDAVKTHIVDHFDIDPDELDDELDDMLESRTNGHQAMAVAHSDPPAAALSLAGQLASFQDATPKLLIKLLRRSERVVFEQLFGRISELRAPRLQQVLYGGDGRELAVACRALDIPKADFAVILFLSRQEGPGQEVEDPRQVARVIAYFERIDRPEAQVQLERWQRGEPSGMTRH